MKKRLTIVGCAALVFAASHASAYDTVVSQRNGDWGDTNVWLRTSTSKPDLPGVDDGTQIKSHMIDLDGDYSTWFVQMFGPSTLNVPAGTSLSCSYPHDGPGVALGVSRPFGTATLNITGGVVSATSNANLSSDAGNTSVLNVSAGAFNVGGKLYVGLSGMTTVHLDGGVIRAHTLIWEEGGDNGSSMDITGGTLILDGNAVTQVNAIIAQGDITAYGGERDVGVDYNRLNPGKTTVSVPMPATLALVGVGVLALIIRRR